MRTEHTIGRFDTHDIVKAFIKGGMKEPLAEVVVKAISEARNHDISQLATKLDLMEVEKRLSIEVEKIRNDVEKSRVDFIKWQVATIITLGSIMITCFKFFGH